MAPVLLTTQESWVTLNVGRQPIDFLLNTGATFQSSSPILGPSHESATFIFLASWLQKFFTQPLSCDWESIFFSHAFLIVPESPTPLLERDIL